MSAYGGFNKEADNIVAHCPLIGCNEIIVGIASTFPFLFHSVFVQTYSL